MNRLLETLKAVSLTANDTESNEISKPLEVRKTVKAARPQKKRNLDNTALNSHFGKSPENIWDKDIHTGESL